MYSEKIQTAQGKKTRQHSRQMCINISQQNQHGVFHVKQWNKEYGLENLTIVYLNMF